MKISLPQMIAMTMATTALLNLAGCGVMQTAGEEKVLDSDAKARIADVPKSRTVVQVHEGAWLLGEKIRASKPQPEIYDKTVVFKNSATVSLTDIAAWIAEDVGVRAVVEASALASSSTTTAGGATQSFGGRGLPSPAVALGGLTRLPQLPAAGVGFNAGQFESMAGSQQTPLDYAGSFKGFLDLVDARYNVWSRYTDGTVTFYKIETRTFTLPSISDIASMNGSISTGDTSGSSQGTGASGSAPPTQSGSAGGNSSGSGGQTITLGVNLSPWQTLERTATAIAGPAAQVVVDQNLGTLTVTGTPPQCDRLDAWVKNLDVMYGKQVAIDVHVYQVQLSQEDNYGLNLSLAYKSATGHTSASMNSVAPPTVSSSSTPMSFGATILGGPLAGTSAAIQALSTLGNVSQLISRSGVTQNGKLLALQSAKQQGYVASTQSTQTASVGSSTSMQTATLTPGFTSSFLPKVIDGRILIDFDMTLSDLQALQTFTSGSGAGQSSVQLPTMQLTRFEQSVSLKPGDTLVLTGMRQQSTSTTNNGVGTPYMSLLGGGVDAQIGDTIIAVVISARLL